MLICEHKQKRRVDGGRGEAEGEGTKEEEGGETVVAV